MAIPSFLKERAKASAGRGVSTDQADNLIPLVYVLQGLSPQVNKRGDAYVEGAEPGDFWIRNAAVPIIKGAEGLIFQPCSFDKEWVEWIPLDDGGGFVGRFPFKAVVETSAIEKGREVKGFTLNGRPLTQVKDPRTNRTSLQTEAGNDLVETRYHTGFVNFADGAIAPYVIPFKSTGHTSSRAWMGLIMRKIDDGEIVPAWCYTYKLVTKHRKNKQGEWFVIEAQDHAPIKTEEEFNRGEALWQALKKGEKTFDEETEVAGSNKASSDDTM
jgi:hypothetical protein